MANTRATAPAAADALDSTTPPDVDTGAGTTAEVAGEEAPALPDDQPVALSPNGNSLAPVPQEAPNLPATPEPVYRPAPGAADFDPEAAGVSAADLEEHLRILTARKALRELTAPTPVPVTVVDAAFTSAPMPAEQGITKIDRRNGNPQTLPAKAWALLPAEDLAEFDDQPAKPASTL